MYSIEIQRAFPYEETWFLQATLLEDGKPFAYVGNRGTGGSNFYRPFGTDYEAARADLERFHDYAASLPWEFDFEVSDQYVETLIDSWFRDHPKVSDLLAIGLSLADLESITS